MPFSFQDDFYLNWCDLSRGEVYCGGASQAVGWHSRRARGAQMPPPTGPTAAAGSGHSFALSVRGSQDPDLGCPVNEARCGVLGPRLDRLSLCSAFRDHPEPARSTGAAGLILVDSAQHPFFPLAPGPAPRTLGVAGGCEVRRGKGA